MRAQPTRSGLLVAIKALHTLVWAVLVGCILGIPLTGSLHRFGLALILTGIVLGECLALAANPGAVPAD